jgi:hypothetical protein
MALHSSLPIYKSAYELLRLVTEVTRNMPRDFKRALGERVRDECIAISVLVLRANIARDKTPHLDALLEHKEVANLLTRLSCDLHCISTGQYARLIALLDSIGKQANAWRKKFATSPAA